MGFLQPIPADKLEATWNFLGGTLTLFASGNALKFTSGIKFYPRANVGSFPCWELMGWVGPRSPGTQPYTHSQPLPHAQVRYVVIITSNNPQGFVVKVQMNYPDHGPVIDNGSEGNENVPTADVKAPETVQLPVVDMDVFYKRQFQIQHSAHTVPMGTINLILDANYLIVKDARIVNNNIVWVLDPIKVGETQAIVHVSHGVQPYESGQTYNIRVNPDLVISTVSAPTISKQQSTQTAIDSADANGDRSGVVILYPWEFRVQTALDKVKEQHPDAELYSVTNVTENPQGGEDLDWLNKMVVKFRDARGSIVIWSPVYNEWGPPIQEQMVIGNANVKWPVPLAAEDALKKARKQGYTQNVKSVYLGAPLGPFPYVPIYTFIFVDDSRVEIPGDELPQA